jgi:hypothetical protein
MKVAADAKRLSIPAHTFATLRPLKSDPLEGWCWSKANNSKPDTRSSHRTQVPSHPASPSSNRYGQPWSFLTFSRFGRRTARTFPLGPPPQ